MEAGTLRLSEAVDALLNESIEQIRAPGSVQAHVAYGDAAEELALYSASLDPRAVGWRGYVPIGRRTPAVGVKG